MGWFVTYKAPRILKAKGTQAAIIKLTLIPQHN